MTISAQDGRPAESPDKAPGAPALKALGSSDAAAVTSGSETVGETPGERKLRMEARRKRELAAAHRSEAASGVASLTERMRPERVLRPVAVAVPPRTIARPRHYAALAVFLLLVLLPFATTVWYLYTRAADRYHSDVAFSIRSEEGASGAAGLLGALTQIGSGTASEPDIVFEYIRSQEIVAAIDKELDLRAIFNGEPSDWVFSLGKDATIEDLVRHWNRMVDVSYESNAGIIEVRATAFTPEDAQRITKVILEQSTELVNHLAEQARTDAIRFAKVDLGEAEMHLRDLRQQLADFRGQHKLVDPAADLEGQMGLLNALQGELARALVDRDMLLTYAEPADQRVQQANRRITAISDRIEDERGNLGVPGATGGEMPQVVGDFEALKVDLEFASSAYTQAMANLAVARAEARRQSRYLAAHVEPTLAQRSLYPRRAILSGLVGLFLVLGWSVVMLVYYNVRDNR